MVDAVLTSSSSFALGLIVANPARRKYCAFYSQNCHSFTDLQVYHNQPKSYEKNGKVLPLPAKAPIPLFRYLIAFLAGTSFPLDIP